MDLAELTQRAKEGKPLYGESNQPDWVQGAAHRNSVFSQLKFCTLPYPGACILSSDNSWHVSCIPNVCHPKPHHIS
jgi:hypothetical protein